MANDNYQQHGSGKDAPAPSRPADPLDQFAEWAMTGEGRSPDDVAPDASAPDALADLAQCMYLYAEDCEDLRAASLLYQGSAMIVGQAALLSTQARELQRLQAVRDAAREYQTAHQWYYASFGPDALLAKHAKWGELKAALSAADAAEAQQLLAPPGAEEAHDATSAICDSSQGLP